MYDVYSEAGTPKRLAEPRNPLGTTDEDSADEETTNLNAH